MSPKSMSIPYHLLCIKCIGMSYMQKRFSQNICRACNKTFCCEKCRIKHEENVHSIFPNCDICIYGRILSSRALQVPGLLEHINKQHWPIHCLFCKRCFATINELIEHNRCPVGPPKMEILNAKTPMRPVNIVCSEDMDSNFNSPPIGILVNSKDIGKIFGTSTPMQGGEIGYEIFPETITPVDNTERKTKIKHANENLSIPYNNEDQKKDKRRVTFNETPQTEQVQRFDNLQALKGSLKKCEPQKLCLKEDISWGIESETGADKCSTKVMSTELSDNKENDLKDKPVVIKKRRSSVTGDTVWQSAMEDQLGVDEGDDDVFKNNAPQKKLKMMQDSYENSPSYNAASDSQFSIVSSSYIDGSSLGDCSDVEKTGGIWSSMAFLVKSVVKGFSKGSGNESINSNKRHLSDSEVADVDMRKLKRIKLTDIKCRPPIRHTYRKVYFAKKRVEKLDKATQTEDVNSEVDLM